MDRHDQAYSLRADIEPGVRISARYRLIRLLGRGRNAEVQGVVDEHTGQAVALRIARYAKTEPILFAEYEVAGRLDHPNIVGVREIIRLDDGRSGLVIEWVRGERLDRCLPLPPDAALDVALGVAQAVAASHGRGLVHGCLSLESFLVEKRGDRLVPRLIDLNYATLYDDPAISEQRPRPTSHHLPYTAPEVLGGRPPSPRSDLYSLGCILHELFLGVAVFPDATGEDLVTHHLSCEPEVPVELEATLRALLLALLAKWPDSRPASAEWVLDQLAGFAGHPPDVEQTALAQSLLTDREIVGQGHVLSRLEEAVDRLMTGRGTAIMIAGVSGSGRSAVGEWLRSRASVAGAVTIAVESAARQRNKMRGNHGRSVSAGPRTRPELAAGSLAPSATPSGGPRPGHGPQTGIGHSITRTIDRSIDRGMDHVVGATSNDCLRALLELMPTRRDSLTLADPVSAIAYRLVEQADARPRVVVFDRPSEDAGVLREVHECLAAAARLSPLLAVIFVTPPHRFGLGHERLTLERLDGSRRRELVASRIGLEDPTTIEETARLLDSAGVSTPREALGLLETMVTRGVLVRRDGWWQLERAQLWQESASLSNFVEGTRVELEGLNQAALHVLTAAAVLGRPAELRALVEVSGVGVEATQRAVATLVEATLLKTFDNRLYEIADDGLSKAAQAMSAVETLHRAAASVILPHVESAEQGAWQTWHRLHAGDETAPQAVVESALWWLGKGKVSRALQLVGVAERRGLTAGGELVRMRARLLVALGDLDGAREVLEAAHESQTGSGVLESLAEILVRLRAFEEVIDVTRGHPPTLRTQLELARAHLGQGDHQAAEIIASEVVRALRDLGDDAGLLGGAICVRAECAAAVQDLQRAQTLAKAGLERIGDRDERARADLLQVLGTVTLTLGDLASARGALERACADNRALGRSRRLATCLRALAMAHTEHPAPHRADWEAAIRHWLDLQILAARLNQPEIISEAGYALGLAYLRITEVPRAISTLRRAIEIAERHSLALIVAKARGALGQALQQAGELADAEAAFEQAGAELRALDAVPQLIAVERCRAELLLVRNDGYEALSLADALVKQAEALLLPLEVGRLNRIRAAALRVTGVPAAAERLVSEAIRAFERLGASYDQGLALAEMARVLHALKRHTDAAAVAEQAVHILARLGATAEVEVSQRLAKELSTADRASDRKLLRGQVLLDVAQNFGSTLTLGTLLPNVLERVVALLGSERGLVALFDGGGEVEQAVVHNLEWHGPGTPLPVSRGIIEQVVSTGEPVAIADVTDDSRYKTRQSVVLHGLRSVVCVPVRDRQRVVGVIYVDSRVTAETSLDEELELMTALARLVDTAVVNARLFEEQRFRTQLLAAMVHDFRSPLSVVQVNAMLLNSEAWIDQNDVKAMASDIEASAQRMLRIVDDTLELSKIDVGSDAPTPKFVDLARFVEDQVKPLRAIGRPHGVGINVAAQRGLYLAHTVPERLAMVMNNLVFNALKFAPADSEIVIYIRRRTDAGPADARARPPDDSALLFRRVTPLVAADESGYLETTVHNRGDPIPEALRESLFQIYVSGKKKQRGVTSTGLGLSIVDQCTRHLGGCVWVESDAQNGTRFSFTLPTQIKGAAVSATERTQEHSAMPE